VDLLLLPYLGDLNLVGSSANALDNFEWSKAKVFQLLRRSFGGEVPTVKQNELPLLVRFVIAYVLVVLLFHAFLSIFESRLNFLKGLLALRCTSGSSRHVHLSTRVIAIVRMLTITAMNGKMPVEKCALLL
jgi:hypothetical protein